MQFEDKMIQAPEVKPEAVKIEAEQVVDEIEDEKKKEIEEI